MTATYWVEYFQELTKSNPSLNYYLSVFLATAMMNSDCQLPKSSMRTRVVTYSLQQNRKAHNDTNCDSNRPTTLNYNAADARHVGFPRFGWRGVPFIVVGIRASLSCYKPSIQSVRHLLPCYRIFEVKFWFPQFGGRGPLWSGPSWCQMGYQWLPRTALQNR